MKYTASDSFQTQGDAAKKFLNHLVSIFQKDPRYFLFQSETSLIPGVTVIVFENIPEPGMITSFTYGLSLMPHPQWVKGRPELCISVDSPSIEWGIAIGEVANQLRGQFAFSYGEVIRHGGKISKDSEMDAFFVFSPSTVSKEYCQGIDIGKDYLINLVNLYPMYSSEIEIFQRIGLKEFWHHPDFDNYSVRRKPIV